MESSGENKAIQKGQLLPSDYMIGTLVRIYVE